MREPEREEVRLDERALPLHAMYVGGHFILVHGNDLNWYGVKIPQRYFSEVLQPLDSSGESSEEEQAHRGKSQPLDGLESRLISRLIRSSRIPLSELVLPSEQIDVRRRWRGAVFMFAMDVLNDPLPEEIARIIFEFTDREYQ